LRATRSGLVSAVLPLELGKTLTPTKHHHHYLHLHLILFAPYWIAF
jgi:hypothetical protein